MNKNVKRIVAIALAVGSVSAVAPATNLNLLTTKAYASSSDADELDSVDLQDDDGDSIDLYTDDDRDDELDGDLDEGETYYAESSTDQVSIDSVDGANEDKVRIFEGSDDYGVGDSIDIDDGITTLKVRVYEDDYDEDEDYSSSDYNQYTIKVEYNDDSDDDDDDDDDDDENDERTLDSLELSDKDNHTIDIYADDVYDEDVASDEVKRNKTYYAKTSSNKISFDISSDADDEFIKVFEDDDDDTEGQDIDDDINISKNTTITVRIYSEEPDSDITYEDDNDVIGEYKIDVKYTGNTSTGTSTTNTATTTPSTATNVTTTKTNQWVKTNGIWQYYDIKGSLAKNSWIQNYFVDANGNMATGWLTNNGSWYYLGTDGAKKTGWQSVGGTWYYLDTAEGRMQTGWMKDMSGKYYYLNSNGSMAYNTTIGGYKLDATGAWTGR